MKINEFLTEQQLDELNWQDVKKYAKRAGNKLANVPGAIQRGAKSIEQGANNYTQGVNQTGNAVAGAVNALGRAGAETFKQGIARPVSAAWSAGKNIAQNATGTVQQGYGDIKQGAQALGKGVTTARQDIGNAGKWAGDELSAVGRGVKSVGQGATNVLGGAGNVIGAVASAPQGFGRAIKRGYGAGVNAIGGPSDEELAGQTSPTQATQQTSQPASATGGVATPDGTTSAGSGFMSGLGQEPAAQAIRDYGKTTGGVTSAPGANTEVPATPAQGQPAQQSRDTTARRNARSNIVKKVGAPAGKKAVDTAVSAIKSIRKDRQPEVIDYAKQQINALGTTWRGKPKLTTPATPGKEQTSPKIKVGAGKINVGNPVMETDFSAILLRKMQ
jgi:uncharacterized phage infection (PIP) family protein YhgE